MLCPLERDWVFSKGKSRFAACSRPTTRQAADSFGQAGSMPKSNAGQTCTGERRAHRRNHGGEMIWLEFVAGFLLFYALWWEIPMHLRDIATELKRMNDQKEGK